MNSNVVGLNEVRQNRDLKEDNRDDVLAAMWYGVEHSMHSKDSAHPELPGTLAQFAAHVANIDPRFYLLLLAKYMEPPPATNDRHRAGPSSSFQIQLPCML